MNRSIKKTGKELFWDGPSEALRGIHQPIRRTKEDLRPPIVVERTGSSKKSQKKSYRGDSHLKRKGVGREIERKRSREDVCYDLGASGKKRGRNST